MAGLRFLADRDRSESRTQRSSQWSLHYVEEQTSGLRSARLMARIAISSPGRLDPFPFGSDSSPTPPVSFRDQSSLRQQAPLLETIKSGTQLYDSDRPQRFSKWRRN